jgi:hypothetical protein
MNRDRTTAVFQRIAQLSTLMVFAATLGACSAEVDDGEGNALGDETETSAPRPVGVTEQAIVLGTRVAEPYDSRGIVSLWWWSTTWNEYEQVCTGTMLTNNVFSTAAHCVNDIFTQADLNKYRVTLGTSDTPRTLVGYSRHPDPNIDAAVLQVSQSYSVLGQSSGFRRSLSPGAGNLNVVAMGYGNYRADRASTSTICHSGTWNCLADRRPLMFANQATGWNSNRIGLELSSFRNSAGQVCAPGDSGGPLFLTDSTTMIGIESRLDHSGTFCQYAPIYNRAQLANNWLCQWGSCAF